MLLPQATALAAADERAHAVLTTDLLRELTDGLPDVWLANDARLDPAGHRQVHTEFLIARLASSSLFTEEAENARQAL